MRQVKKTAKPTRILTGIVCLMVSFQVSAQTVTAQTCNEAIPESTPLSGFTTHGDGTVTAEGSGLMWMRCSLGQTFTGSSCSGVAVAVNFVRALGLSSDHVFAGYDDWRLPNVKELNSIVEERCYSPAINLVIFPATVPSFYRTSSPSAYYRSDAWSVNFKHGFDRNNSHHFNSQHVRLVRAGK